MFEQKEHAKILTKKFGDDFFNRMIKNFIKRKRLECFNEHRIWMQRAPEPEDIIWENVGVKLSIKL